MPAIRSTDQAKASGRQGVRAFIGYMTEFEDDVEGEYGVQIITRYRDVEVTESDDGWQPEDGSFFEYVKQSDKKNSAYAKKLDAHEQFARDHDFLGDDVWESFYDKRIEYRLTELIPGSSDGKFSASHKFVPVRLVGDDEEVGTAEAEAPAEIPEVLVDAVMAFLESNGDSTPAVIERSMKTKAATRKALGEAGGIQPTLDHMVAQQMLYSSEEGVYRLEEE